MIGCREGWRPMGEGEGRGAGAAREPRGVRLHPPLGAQSRVPGPSPGAQVGSGTPPSGGARRTHPKGGHS